MLDSANISYSLPKPEVCGYRPAVQMRRVPGSWFLAQDGSLLQRMARMAHSARTRRAARVARRVLYPAGAFSWFRQGSAVSFDYPYSLVVDGALLAQRQQDAHRSAPVSTTG